jgi:hypothetical protein
VRAARAAGEVGVTDAGAAVDGRSAEAAGAGATSREQPAVATPAQTQAASTRGTAPDVARRTLLGAVVT